MAESNFRCGGGRDVSAAGSDVPLSSENPLNPGGGAGDAGAVCGLSSLSQENVENSTHSTKFSGCVRDSTHQFCWIVDPAHVNSPDHVELVVDFLVRVWKFRGARRFLVRYGMELVCEIVCDVLVDVEFNPDNAIRSPAAVLTHRVKGAFDDGPGDVGRRLVEGL